MQNHGERSWKTSGGNTQAPKRITKLRSHRGWQSTWHVKTNTYLTGPVIYEYKTCYFCKIMGKLAKDANSQDQKHRWSDCGDKSFGLLILREELGGCGMKLVVCGEAGWGGSRVWLGGSAGCHNWQMTPTACGCQRLLGRSPQICTVYQGVTF